MQADLDEALGIPAEAAEVRRLEVQLQVDERFQSVAPPKTGRPCMMLEVQTLLEP